MTRELNPEHDLQRALSAKGRVSAAAQAHGFPICPECAAGKHRNCDGQAWDDDVDEPTQCLCSHESETNGGRP